MGISKKIIVTGANGFVGSNLVPYLNELGFQCIPFKARDFEESIIQSDVYAFIHLSGKAHDLKNTVNDSDYIQGNFELTKKVYDIYKSSNSSKFIFMSSVKAVCDSTTGILDENFEPSPATSYGKSKLYAEKYIQEQANLIGKKFFILRPCMIHGPGNKGNLNLLYKFVRLGLPYPLGAYNNERSFLSIDNLNFIIKEILSREDIPEGIYNLADDEPLSTKKIIYTINRVLEKKYMILHIPQCLVKNIARVGDFFKLPFNTIRLNKLTENFVVSNKKIRNVLNGGMPIKAEDGLYMTIESFKSNIN